MRIRVGCEFVWETTVPVPMLMLVKPRADADHLAVYESTWSDPQLSIHEYKDLFGNNCWRFVAPEGTSAVRYDAVVEIPETPDPVVPHAALHAVEDLPDDAIVFTLPSRYVESDKLLDVAWELFGNTAPTWERIQAVCDWVHHNIQFVNGSSTPATTAYDVYQQRMGVCRDFALLSVAFCRALNIPARYTFGYLPDIAIEPPDVPMDFHTWFEAYVGGRWYTFDARHNTPRVGRVVIGRGRDAVDCALSTAYGNARLAKFTVWSDEITAERPGGPPQEEDADNAEAAARAQS
ncbi:MAG TPA: transglutaminase family protein [Patescibacteria group bacterium]|jgi:transglutaminase-like putative cysteine protease|nr:transglutaminase family protein [Patescibacteria group bacterium]